MVGHEIHVTNLASNMIHLFDNLFVKVLINV